MKSFSLAPAGPTKVAMAKITYKIVSKEPSRSAGSPHIGLSGTSQIDSQDY